MYKVTIHGPAARGSDELGAELKSGILPTYAFALDFARQNCAKGQTYVIVNLDEAAH